MNLRGRKKFALGGVLALGAVAATVAIAGTQTGPSSSQSPYVLRSQPGVVTKSILTAGDSVNTGDATVTMHLDDGYARVGQQLYLYRGTKTTTGNPVQKAGLMNGMP